jgi:glycolate oxidase iron-sulfur subunit
MVEHQRDSQGMELNKPGNADNDCILCGRCMEVCPVLLCTGREELSPRAKGLLALRLKESGNGLDLDRVRGLAELCVGCERCSKVCPQSADVPAQIAAIKGRSREWRDWLVKALFTSAPRSWPILMRLHDLAGAKEGGLTQSLTPWLRLIPAGPRPQVERVLLFPGCLARFGAGVWRERARTILESLGIMVEEPEFACCGFPLGRSGLLQERAAAAETNLRLWREGGRSAVVTLCATCWSGLREYGELLDMNPAEREIWLHAVRPLGSFLERERCETTGAPPPGGVTVHRPCHGPVEPWIERTVSGTVPTTVSTHCCGFGGTLQLTGRPLSRIVAGSLWQAAAPGVGAQIVTGCSGCVLQLKMTAPQGVEAGHWLEIVQPA